jgi:cytochrome b561
MTRTRYTFLQRLLHWLIALIVFGLLAAGFTFWGLGYEGTVNLFGQETTNQLYTYHKSFGILLFLLMVLRLVLRRVNPAPPYDPPLGAGERFVSGSIHVLIYIVLLAMPIGGWIATAAGGFPVQFFQWELPGLVPKNEALSEQVFLIHGIAGLVLTALVLVHIAAGLKHWKLKDGVMRRISLP